MKIFFSIISQVAVVNALMLYQQYTNTKIKIVQFHKEILALSFKLHKPTTRQKHIL